MQAGTCGGATKREVEMLATPGERGVSGVDSSRPSIPKIDVKKPSVCRRGRWKMSRSVSAVSMARSEYCSCPPRLPTPTASQVAIASGANHTVISPRWTSARSYAGQFPTWYFALYFGCTLDFMSRSFTCRRYDGQEVDPGSPRARDPCTNAAATRRVLPRRRAGGWRSRRRGRACRARWRCCTNRDWPARYPPTGSSPADAI